MLGVSGLDEMPSSLKESEEISPETERVIYDADGNAVGWRGIPVRRRRRRRRLSDLVIGVISLITCNLLYSGIDGSIVADMMGHFVLVGAMCLYGIVGLFYLYHFIVGRRIGRRYTGYRRRRRRY